MTNTIKRFFKTTIITLIALQIVFTSQVFAFENVKIHTVAQSNQEIVKRQGNKLMLKQDWYGLRFEINPATTYRTKYSNRTIKSVKTSEYTKALEQVKFDVDKVGEYNVYFLNYKLKDYSNAMALSFKDDSVVVFGTTRYMTKQKIHRLAVHELGHQVDFQLMNNQKWEEYKKIRGIENEKIYNNSSKVYANRPQEIFAEDFRLVLGGDLAKKTSHINKSLKNPNSIPELVEFFNDLVK